MLSVDNNNKLYEGFFDVCTAVSRTMGAQGKLAVMENEILGNPLVTKDGISTAKRIHFRDPEKKLGAQLAKQVAARTLVKAGDSTTTSLVLSQALVKATQKESGEFFYNKRVEQGFEKAMKETEEWLDILSQPTDDNIIQRIAEVSSNNNPEIGQLVFHAYKAVGPGGVIDIQENHKSSKSTTEIFRGMKLMKGWQTPFLINNQKTAKWEATDAKVLVYEGYLEGDPKVQRWLQENSNSPIIIVAERFHDDTIIKIQDFNQRGLLNITAVQAPDYDHKRKAYLSDLALYCGGEVFLKGSDKKTQIKSGSASRVIVTENSTSFIQEEVMEGVSDRIENLKGQMKEVQEDDFLKRRIQNLEGVSATIYVGGTNETEVKEKYDRVEDSVCSVQSAEEEGWIAGGGSTLTYISSNLRTNIKDEEIMFGYNAFREALEAPFKTICANSNRNAEQYIEQSRSAYGVGYNAYTDELENLIENDIVDSKKSIRVALDNAQSVAKLLLQTAVVITNDV